MAAGYDTIICLADNSSKSAWTRWLLRQVDMIMLVGYSDENPVSVHRACALA